MLELKMLRDLRSCSLDSQRQFLCLLRGSIQMVRFFPKQFSLDFKNQSKCTHRNVNIKMMDLFDRMTIWCPHSIQDDTGIIHGRDNCLIF